MKLLKKHKIIIAIILSFFSISVQGQAYSIFGTIKDSISGEIIQGASVSIQNKANGVTSNSYGFFSLKAPKGYAVVTVSHVSYENKIIRVQIAADTMVNVLLAPSRGTSLDTVVVGNRKGLVPDHLVNKYDLRVETIKKIPSLGGESDLLKSVQLLPGVNVVNEGSTNLYVRGGSFDQNLILLDESPVFNPSHALGFFSTFNTDAIRSVQFYKGGFPAEYGGRLSSVLDVHMKEGNTKKQSLEGGVGLLASRILWQGPLKKDTSSFIVSGRYSYVGKIIDGISWLSSEQFISKNDIHFFDLNAKINLRLGKKDRLYLSTYTGRDNFYSYPLDETNRLNWGNTTATARWNHHFNSTLFSNISALWSNYKYSYYSLVDAKNFIWKSDIKVGSLKADFDWYASNSHTVKSGLAVTYNYFQPGRIVQRDSTSVIREFALEKKQSLETSVYLSDKIRVSDKIGIQLGVRATSFLNIGPGKVYNYSADMSQVTDSTIYSSGQVINRYVNFEPRTTVTAQITNTSSIRFSYSRTNQYLHLISNSTVGLPTDVWIPADRYLRPQRADQFAIGFIRTLAKKDISISLEVYHKQLKNILDYRDNANLFLNPQLEKQTLSGLGRSTGVEFLLEKRTGPLTGWVSYTWSSTKLKIEGINENRWYPARYDINHNITATGSYQLNECWTFSATFRLTSGAKITVPGGDFTYFGGTFNYYVSRNGYQLPIYHRLDISGIYKRKNYTQQRIKREWVFSVFNVYNRYNLFALYIKPDPVMLDQARAYKFYLYGVVPSITVNFKM